jgi:hypothetical protein
MIGSLPTWGAKLLVGAPAFAALTVGGSDGEARRVRALLRLVLTGVSC